MKSAAQKQLEITSLWKDMEKETGTKVNLTMIQTFMLICQNPEITMKDIVKETKLSYPAVSKVLWNLGPGDVTTSLAGGEKTKHQKNGLRLIELDTNMYDRRSQELKLSDKGKAFIRQMEEIMQ